MFWSPFLLDGMAGLRDDTKPSCDECKDDPAYLAKNSGLVGPLAGAAGTPSQFGVVSTVNICVDAPTEDAQKLAEFMLTDGYVRWLGLSPQGKYPVRAGDRLGPEEVPDGVGGARERRRPQGPAEPVLRRGLDRLAGRRRRELPALGLRPGPGRADRRAAR